jgi:hypothetical protein
VGVDDGMYVGTCAINVGVHRQLGRGTTAAAHALPGLVDDDEIGRANIALGDTSGRDDDPSTAQPDRDVALPAGNQTTIVQSPADIDDRSSRRCFTAPGGGHQRYGAAR